MRPGPSLLRSLASAALLRGSRLLADLATVAKGEAPATAPGEGKAVVSSGTLPSEVTPEAAALLAKPPLRPEPAAPPPPLAGSLEARRAARGL